MARFALMRSAPNQPATAQPPRCSCLARAEKGSGKASGRAKDAAAARMADQESRKSCPRPCPKEESPAKTAVPTKITGRMAVLQRRGRSSLAAAV